jgi:hypothetical protein
MLHHKQNQSDINVISKESRTNSQQTSDFFIQPSKLRFNWRPTVQSSMLLQSRRWSPEQMDLFQFLLCRTSGPHSDSSGKMLLIFSWTFLLVSLTPLLSAILDDAGFMVRIFTESLQSFQQVLPLFRSWLTEKGS